MRKQGEGVVLNYAKLSPLVHCTNQRCQSSPQRNHGQLLALFAILFGALTLDRPTRETALFLRVL